MPLGALPGVAISSLEPSHAPRSRPSGRMWTYIAIRLRLFEQDGRMPAEPILGFDATRREAYLGANAQFYLKKGLCPQAGERVLAEWLIAPEYM